MNRECLTKAAVLAEKGAFLFVTTASFDGYPHVAPAARLQLSSKEARVAVDSWFCPGTLENLKGNLFTGISDEDNVYFVHSYYAELSEETIATCRYILPFSAAMQKDNFYATQFHPEKSAWVGERILKNFLEL